MANARLKKVKEGELWEIYQSDDKEKTELILIKDVRISFAAIGHMKEDTNDDGSTTKKYKASPMLEKGKHDEARTAFNGIMKRLLEKHEAKVAPENRCIKDGDDSEREEYQGHWIISASESKRPVARDAKGRLYLDPAKVTDGDDVEAALDRIDEQLYSGMYVNILLRPWFFGGKVKGKTKTFPKRICCGLMAVQWFRKGEPFSQGTIDDSGIDWSTGDDNDDDDDDLDEKPKSKSKPSKKPSRDDDDDDEL